MSDTEEVKVAAARAMTESETKIARYGAIEREVDAFGRRIGVRRLKPSEQTKLVGLTPELTGFEETLALDETGVMKPTQVPHRAPLSIAAAVCEIDDAKISFPKTRGELDAIFDRLDMEGLTAATKALGRLQQQTGAPANPVETAKNS